MQRTEPAKRDDDKASDISALTARLTAEVNHIARDKASTIREITEHIKMLALNALVESARAGEQGRGFAVVAKEVGGVSQRIEGIARELETELVKRTDALVTSIAQMTERSTGERMVDLSLNAIELIDRNLYERTCDVRWWATDSAVVDCAAEPGPERAAYATERLGVILGAYTVYLDLWLCDPDGNILANGRPDKFDVQGRNVAHASWFRQALALRTGDDYVAGDVERQPLLGDAQVATYCASVRLGGQARGRPSGILAIHFDWETQARAIVQGVRLDDDASRVLLVDANAGDRRLRWSGPADRAPQPGHRQAHERLRQGQIRGACRFPRHARVRDLQGSGLVRRDRQRGRRAGRVSSCSTGSARPGAAAA